ALYNAHPRDRTAVPTAGHGSLTEPACLSGGGGLHGTAHDYHRFASMLAGRGELDGVRLLGPRTVDFMTANHLPRGADLESFGRALFAETPFTGVGFGLGVSVTLDPVAAKAPGSPGDYGWGGAASTTFWVDPVEDLSVLFLTQLLPSSAHPIRSQLRALVHQAIVGR
ncbi:MAG: serine hydrolase, partial [Acidimicrobiales bacterium]